MIEISLDSDVPQFQDALMEHIKSKKIPVSEALRTQGRLLAKRLSDFTPPKTLSQGKMAVKRDIERAIRPLRPQDFQNKEIRRLIRKGDIEALSVIFSRFSHGDLKGATITRFDPKLHRQVRNRRGRVAKWTRKATPDAAEARAYIKETHEHVGMAKGGWAASFIALGGSPAAWIGRHANQGEIEDRSGDPIAPYIRMFNRSPWTKQGDEDRIRANAMRARARDIAAELLKSSTESLRQAIKGRTFRFRR